MIRKPKRLSAFLPVFAIVLAVMMICPTKPFGSFSFGITAYAESWTDEGNYASAFAGGKGTEADPYLIGNAQQLAFLAMTSENESGYLNTYFKMTEDIDLEGKEWTPIFKFKGYFDGNGKAVKNIYIDSSENFMGLFSSVDKGIVKDLRIEGGSVSGASYVGGLCGSNSGKLENCHNSCIVSGTGDYVGGLCGISYSSMYNCSNTGAVSGKTDVGGLCGEITDYSVNNITVTDCYNTGTVSSTGYNAGGLFGIIMTVQTSSSITVTDCYNSGIVNGKESVGGICGKIFPAHPNSTIEYSYNTGEISGESNIGGICGYNSGTVDSCYCTDTSKVSGTASYIGGICGRTTINGVVTNCSNAGSVITTNNYVYVGGVCGYNSGTVDNCSNKGEISGYSYVGGVCGLSIENSSVKNSNNSGTVIGTSDNVGGVCGELQKGVIIDKCNNTGKVSGQNRIGGVCGNNNTTVTNCFNSGEISSAADYVGGVCGYSEGSIDSCYNTEKIIGDRDFVGGVCGYGKGSVKNCYNTGSVTGILPGLEDITYRKNSVGGVCGFIEYCTIENCYNSGTIFGVEYVGGICGRSNTTSCSIKNCNNSGEINGAWIIGGVCGLIYISDSSSALVESYISNCYNTGNVSATSGYSGGICGVCFHSGYIENCFNTGAVSDESNSVGGICGSCASTGRIEYCYNIGTVSGTGEYDGGVCGENYGNVTNCFYNKDFCKYGAINNADSDGAKGLATIQMTSSDALAAMGFDTTVWSKQDNDKAAGTAYYPTQAASDYSPCINYKTVLDMTVSEDCTPQYGGKISFDVSALIHFDGMSAPAADSKALTNGKGSFAIALGGSNVVESTDISDNTSVKVSSSQINSSGNLTFSLNYNGAGSDYITDGKVSLVVNIGQPVVPDRSNIVSAEVTSDKVIVKFKASSDNIQTAEYAFDQVSEEVVDYMRSEDIKLVIDFVNFFNSEDEIIILTSGQMKAIQFVLENDKLC